jgi:hypothetical protein
VEQIGGTESMVLGALLSGGFFGVVAIVLSRWLGWVTASAMAGFMWSVVVIALVTLIPLTAIDLQLPAEARDGRCSTDYGGPAPEGFWIFSGTQRTLNTALFVPAGALLVLAAARWRVLAWVVVPLGLAGLAAYSVAIELAQLELASIGRACDVTDVVDNVTGAVIGVALGVFLALALRPWRHRQRARGLRSQ